ncbi:MAG: 2-aminoethylphosphonate aminotransferase [Candidatus Accumulibacter phosphatis]|jgi:2-aminoethylphosphonate-pyruvate transaminase|uniref:2-aminoethylphosphonate--pyruvate transaminase n=2 Tax=Candidatus Accumulibacter TaxID=327159 RepID=A0A080M014_9PROT|nr:MULTISPECIES: 2-aminoethylphosphonate aminotransferase [Candidatus Accumulibacter]KFB74466.1 MAG: 2-aminoethylphosphonate--pyruvate transaminase [Candidatus Accumulibacter phosphatis]NMQ04303.1 2-aminoethylphosphonate aminotransferase [Candidatus Accumulibacter contiguus]HRF06770.1 2-aminoethylphosphonate aminotransferase [Accumulibacter sp.]
MILLNPGPVTLSQRVRNALLHEDLCHRESEFAELSLDLRARIERVYPEAAADFTAVLLTGSGTAAVEAMLNSIVPPTARCLVVANGVYGERMATMLARHRRPHALIDSPWLSPIPLQRIDEALVADPGIAFVACVQHETTTGRLNDIDSLGAICRRHGVNLLLDAVSSFAAEELRFAEWNLVAVAAAANKCLHGIPGTAFVLARRDLLTGCADHADSLYLDLYPLFREQQAGWSPFTQSVQGFFALQEALREFADAGGQPARRHRYLAISSRLRRELPTLGAELLLAEADYASMLTSFRLPFGNRYATVHDGLKRAGFTIYAGQGPLAADVFRIAGMGAITDADVDRLLAACCELLAGPEAAP